MTIARSCALQDARARSGGNSVGSPGPFKQIPQLADVLVLDALKHLQQRREHERKLISGRCARSDAIAPCLLAQHPDRSECSEGLPDGCARDRDAVRLFILLTLVCFGDAGEF